MPKYDYVIFYTWIAGATANDEFQLFQVQQNGDATHTEQFTNMRGPGSFPQDETFVLDRIGIIVDHDIIQADVTKLFMGGFLEIRQVDRTVLKAPLSLFSEANAYGGSDTTTAAANGNVIGLLGSGFQLRPGMEITLNGGQGFR